MTNPYADKSDSAFWSRAIAGRALDDIDPVTAPKFTIGRGDRVATAGSCFAQHIARHLDKDGFTLLLTEPGPATTGARDEGYGVFPARFGNLYTTSQLLQLFERAYGLFAPLDSAWRRHDGAWIDPFRPRVQQAGFATREAVVADREAHLAAVRRMFEACDVFIFTLGLTESWMALADGAAFPLAPGVVGSSGDPLDYAFVNLGVVRMAAELEAFVGKLRTINPAVRMLLTVSPTPLIATYEPRHVLVSTIYSKSALRVAAEMVASADAAIDYFPSYEIVAGHPSRGAWFAEDMREVAPAGVEHVMGIFRRHYLAGAAASEADPAPIHQAIAPSDAVREAMQADFEVICDEEAILG